eukprot:COSAG01_NODE_5115_length_4474_cov_4.309943_4_plen_62_part_00
MGAFTCPSRFDSASELMSACYSLAQPIIHTSSESHSHNLLAVAGPKAPHFISTIVVSSPTP